MRVGYSVTVNNVVSCRLMTMGNRANNNNNNSNNNNNNNNNNINNNTGKACVAYDVQLFDLNVYCRILCHFQDTAKCRACRHLHSSMCCQMSCIYAYMCPRGMHAATAKNKVRLAGNCLGACKDLF